MRVMSYEDRANYSPNPAARRLLALMARKQTNLSFAADLSTKEALLSFADSMGPHICLLKTHIDIITDFDQELVHRLKELAQRHDFLIFEDRKFADIGYTVVQQYVGGIYRIAQWADIINAHTVPGPGIIEGLSPLVQQHHAGILLLAQMSSQGTLAHGDYTDRTVAMAHRYSDTVIGFISRHRLTEQPQFIHMTPGVKLIAGHDPLGQQYMTPEQAIAEHQNDIVIVGRGLITADNPQQVVQEYRERSWVAYLNRLKNSARRVSRD